MKKTNRKKASWPEIENDRLKALYEYRILDTAPEKEFDAIASLASSICNVPMALISFIDDKRQWIKSKHGIEAKELARDVSFCQFTISSGKLHEVNDASKNKILANHPWVKGKPGVRFYASAPIIDHQGFILGTLSVFSTTPGKLSDDQKKSMLLLAETISGYLNLRKNNSELKDSKRMLVNFFDLSPDFMCTANAEGYFLQINNSFNRKLGYTNEELLEKSFFNFIHPDDFQNTLNQLKNCKNGDTVIEFENRYRRKDGTYIWISWNACPDPVNGLIFATARDITEKKNIQEVIRLSAESLNRAQSIAKIGSWEFNLKNFDLVWSREHYKIFELEDIPADQLYEAYRNKIHPGDLPQLNLVVQDAIEKGLGFTFEHRVMCNDGSIKYVVGIGEVVKDILGDPVIMRGTVQDITERKLAEQKIKESEESLSNAQSISKVGSWEFDLSTKDLKWSKEMYRIFEMEEVPFDFLFEACRTKILPEDLLKMDDAIQYAMQNGEALNLEHRILCKDGSIKHLLGIGKVYKDESGKPKWMKGTVQDVTEGKRIERELKIAKDLAEQAVVVKDSFLANMSHEIRTPMNVIIGFADLLSQTSLDPSQDEFVDSIRLAGENLLSVINDILDFSKIESGKIVIHEQPFKIRELLKNVHKLLKVKADEKKLDLELIIDEHFPDVVNGDGSRLSQVLINLVGNAIKFTDTGSVCITANCLCENEERFLLNFSVKDTGIGIPPEKMESVFERFTQVNNELHRKFGGTGLGLSISKSLIDLMGGEMYLKSEVNNGSEFTFQLKFFKDKLQDGHVNIHKQEIRKFHGKSTILVFEDNVLNQRLVSNVLENFGFGFELAGNGKEGLKKLKHGKYDVILMDLQMPDMDGYQVTSVIRNEMKIKTPILAMTAHSMSGEREKCMSHGMNDYLSKPFKQEELFKKISDLLFMASEILNLEDDQPEAELRKNLINLDYLKELSAGNRNFEKEMLEIFISKVSADIELLQLAIEREDFKSVKDQAHELMSSLPIAGLADLEEQLIIIEEDAAKEIINETTLVRFKKIKDRLEECYPVLKKVIAEDYQ